MSHSAPGIPSAGGAPSRGPRVWLARRAGRTALARAWSGLGALAGVLLHALAVGLRRIARRPDIPVSVLDSDPVARRALERQLRAALQGLRSSAGPVPRGHRVAVIVQHALEPEHPRSAMCTRTAADGVVLHLIRLSLRVEGRRLTPNEVVSDLCNLFVRLYSWTRTAGAPAPAASAAPEGAGRAPASAAPEGAAQSPAGPAPRRSGQPASPAKPSGEEGSRPTSPARLAAGLGSPTASPTRSAGRPSGPGGPDGTGAAGAETPAPPPRPDPLGLQRPGRATSSRPPGAGPPATRERHFPARSRPAPRGAARGREDACPPAPSPGTRAAQRRRRLTHQEARTKWRLGRREAPEGARPRRQVPGGEDTPKGAHT
jgi:hypothetical protein